MAQKKSYVCVCLFTVFDAKHNVKRADKTKQRSRATYHHQHYLQHDVSHHQQQHITKTPKIRAGISRSHTPPAKKKPLLQPQPQRKTGILPQTSARLIFFCIFVIDIIFYNRKYLFMRLFKKPLHHSGDEVHRMGMYRGMEINLGNRTEMGLSRMARQNSMMKRQQRVNEFADGYRLGEMLEMGMEGMED